MENKIAIDLNAPVCMDQNHAEIVPFDQFEERNSFVNGNALCPLYTKAIEPGLQLDKHGNEWKIKYANNKYRLYRNGEEITALEDGYKAEALPPSIERVHHVQWTYEFTEGLPLFVTSNNYLCTYQNEKLTQIVEINSEYYVGVACVSASEVALVYRKSSPNYLEAQIYNWQTQKSVKTTNYLFDDNFYSIACANNLCIISVMPSIGNVTEQELADTGVGYFFFEKINGAWKADAMSAATFVNRLKPIEAPGNGDGYASAYYFYNSFDSGALSQAKIMGLPLKCNPSKNIVYEKAGGAAAYNIAMSTCVYAPQIEWSSSNYVSSISFSFPIFNGSNHVREEDLTKTGSVTAKWSYLFYPNFFKVINCLKNQNKYDFIIIQSTNMAGTTYLKLPVIMDDCYSLLDANGFPDFPPEYLNFQNYIKLRINLNGGIVSSIATQREANLVINFGIIEDAFPYMCQNTVIFKNAYDGLCYKVSPASPQEFFFVDDYILINSDLQYNAFKIDTLKKENWTVGYNGAVLNIGYNWNQVYSLVFSSAECNFVASVNPFFEISKNPFVGFQPASSHYYGAINRIYIQSVYNKTYSNLLLTFRGEGNNIPVCTNNNTYKGLAYPDGSGIYPLSLSTEFSTFLNNTFLQFFNLYSKMYFANNNNIFAYFGTNFQEKIEVAFNLQGQNFCIFNNFICSLSISQTEFLISSYLVDVTSLIYIGSTLSQAFFYSVNARKILYFAGDNRLYDYISCTNFKNIITTKFSFIQSINSIALVAITTDDERELIIITPNTNFKIKLESAEKLTLQDRKDAVYFDFGLRAFLLSFFKQNDFLKKTLVLKTSYYGMQKELASNISAWYIRFVNLEDEKNGFIKLKSKVLTNKTTIIEEKTIEIKAKDFDPYTKYYCLVYRPKFQNALGYQLEIETDIPIYSLTADQAPATTQLQKNNF